MSRQDTLASHLQATFDPLESNASGTSPTLILEAEQAIPAHFERQVARYADRIAICTSDGLLTYEALNGVANKIARVVQSRCPEEKARVLLFMEQSIPAFAGMLGVLKAGKIYVPLDPAYPPARIAYILEDAEASLVLTNRECAPRAQELLGDACPLINVEEIDESLPDDNLLLDIAPDSIAYLLYTSGSTGQPKGVLQTHRNLLHHVRNYSDGLGIGPGDRLTLFYSVSFSASLMDIYGAFLNGATLYPYNLKRLGPIGLADWLRKEEITIYHSVPTVFRHLMNDLGEEEVLPSIRAVDLGGEPVYKRDVELFRKHFLPGCLLVNHLAFTEASVAARYFIDHHTVIEGHSIPVGEPAPGIGLKIVREDGEEVDGGEVGELVVESRYLSPGYWRKPTLSDAAFRESPCEEGMRLYFTGDLGRRLPDGKLEHLGRKDSRVKIRGHSIEVAEIESALLAQGLLKEVAVIARDDTPGEPRLVAYLVPKELPGPPISILRQAISDRLPSYMMPSAFVMMEVLPVSPNGKVDRRALPPPPKERPESDRPYIAPRNVIESKLAIIWSEMFGVEQVGILDDFFALGGHSLLAARLLERIEVDMDKKLPFEVLLQDPTIYGLARAFMQDQTASPLIEIQKGGHHTPFFFMPGVYAGGGFYTRKLAQLLGPEQPFYILPTLVGDQLPPVRIELIAQRNMEILRAFRPHGPYLLGGFCHGGLIAFEMARSLRAQGERVDLVFFIRTASENTPFRHLDILVGLWARLFHLTDWHRQLLFLRIKKHYGRLRRLVRRLGGKTSRPDFTQRRTSPLRGSVLDEQAELLLPYTTEVRQRVGLAYASYVPRRYDGRVVLLWPAEDRIPLPGDPTHGWRAYVPNIEVYTVPGGHFTCVTQHIEAVAEHLKRCLQEVAKNR
jgi:amino acid adenylation domain-containing protein